jgi:uncharacterized protein with HEPN domain
MPSRQRDRRLNDIIENVDRIRRHVREMTLDEYLQNEKTRDAVERCLQRISEAAAKLGDLMDDRYPEVPWRDIRRFGNVLRHDYDEVDGVLLWRTIQERLDPLRHACAAELGRRGARAGDD